MIVDDKGPNIFGIESGVVAAHGCCNGYEANYKKIDENKQVNIRVGYHQILYH